MAEIDLRNLDRLMSDRAHSTVNIERARIDRIVTVAVDAIER